MRGGFAVNQPRMRQAAPDRDAQGGPASLTDTPGTDGCATQILPSGVCTMCRRFIGPAEVCPYCGSEGQSRISLRFCRRIAFAAATVGLVIIWWAARTRTPPLISLAAITPTMQRAVVTVQGQVLRQPRIHHTAGRPDYLSFPLSDGSNVLYAYAYPPLAGQLVDGGRLPERGARVTATGILTLHDSGAMRLRLDRFDALARISPKPSGL